MFRCTSKAPAAAYLSRMDYVYINFGFDMWNPDAPFRIDWSSLCESLIRHVKLLVIHVPKFRGGELSAQALENFRLAAFARGGYYSVDSSGGAYFITYRQREEYTSKYFTGDFPFSIQYCVF